MAKIYTVFQFNRRISSTWPANYLLYAGEPGYETDTHRLKMGDGVTTWAELPYIGEGVINTDGSLTYSQNTMSISGFSGADAGQVPSKAQDGAITWITPLTEANISESSFVNAWIEGKMAEIGSRTYKGEAYYVNTSGDTITVYATEGGSEVQGELNDVYSYNDKKYIWTGSQWEELTDQDPYATTQTVGALETRVAALENGALTGLATAATVGGVKSSSAVNKIAVENDGTMSINSIGVDKLVNNGYTLILNNGQS